LYIKQFTKKKQAVGLAETGFIVGAVTRFEYFMIDHSAGWLIYFLFAPKTIQNFSDDKISERK